MNNVILFLVYLSASLILYIWFIFPCLMFCLSKILKPRKIVNGSNYLPSISVLISALNEEDTIVGRIENIFSSDYSKELIEVIVISDGSKDRTGCLSQETSAHGWDVKVINLVKTQGRANAHNTGVGVATGEILVFTDAGTVFCASFLREILRPFSAEVVGFSTGALSYSNQGDTDITHSAGLYWRLEQKLRQWESDSGLNVFGSGACCAMRRKLYRTIPLTGDVDFTSPLDVALQGYRCVHVPEALAVDEMPDNKQRELQARIRMTSKNFSGTFARWGMGGVVCYPILTLVILSHKYGRWLTPFLLVILFISSLIVASFSSHLFVLIFLVLQVIFYFVGLCGFLGISVPFGNTISNFLLANYGMGVGVVRAITGRVVSAYVPIRND